MNTKAAGSGTVAPSAAQRSAPRSSRPFGDPPAASRCLTVRLAASNRSYATVRSPRQSNCQQWAFNGVNVIHRSAQGRWRIAFEGSSSRCPVAHIPASVQRDLGVCPYGT
ncbi:MAG: hypothetical protein ACLP0J_15830 [Solirubrobacteraceae bacterium]